MASWCSGYHYCSTSFIKAWTQVLCRFKPCLWHVRGLQWSLTMVLAGNQAKCLSSVNHSAKTNQHHHPYQGTFCCMEDMIFDENLSLVWELKIYPFRKNVFRSQQNIAKVIKFALALFCWLASWVSAVIAKEKLYQNFCFIYSSRTKLSQYLSHWDNFSMNT